MKYGLPNEKEPACRNCTRGGIATNWSTVASILGRLSHRPLSCFKTVKSRREVREANNLLKRERFCVLFQLQKPSAIKYRVSSN